MNSWLGQIAETAIRDHGSLGTDLRSAKDFQSTFEQLAEDMKVYYLQIHRQVIMFELERNSFASIRFYEICAN